MWRADISQIHLHTTALRAKCLLEPRKVLKIIKLFVTSSRKTFLFHELITFAARMPNQLRKNSLSILKMFNLSGNIIEKPEDFDKFIGRSLSGPFCLICNTFSHRSAHSVRTHVENKHFPNSFTYHCPSCERSFGTQKSLQNHKRQHSIRRDNLNQS